MKYPKKFTAAKARKARKQYFKKLKKCNKETLESILEAIIYKVRNDRAPYYVIVTNYYTFYNDTGVHDSEYFYTCVKKFFERLGYAVSMQDATHIKISWAE